MSKIKVTFVETNCKKNGPIKQTLNIIRNMDKEVFEPSLVTVWPEDADNSMIDEYKKLGIPVLSANMSKKKSVLFGKKEVGQLLEQLQPDIVQGVGMPPYRMTLGYKRAIHFVTLRNYCYEDYPDYYGKIPGTVMAFLDLNLIKKRMAAGLVELRKTYSKYLNYTYGRKFDYQTQIAVTVGGMEALYLALLSSIDPGDEVIIFAPYYINYYQMIEMCGGIPVIVRTWEENDFSPKIEDIEKAVTDKTKVIIINTPTNPTGTVYSEKTVTEIVEFARKRNILLVSDEVYSTLVYNESKHFSALSVKPVYENILYVDSCSKKFSMTGWRVGFAVGPKDWIAAIIKLQENVAACTPLPSQYAAIRAFNENPDMTDYVDEFRKRRNVLVKELQKSNRVSFMIPKGTFYMFVNIGEMKIGSTEFAMQLLREKHVAVVPGIAYGDDFDDYIRIAFTMKETVIKEAARRIVEFVEK